MPAPMVKTKTPGIYKRGSRYVVVLYVDGRQVKRSARTYDEARALKRGSETDLERGDYQAPSKVTLHDYARKWVEEHQGGARGIRESTRDDYRRILEQFVLKHFPAELMLTRMTRAHVKGYVTWLTKQTKPAPTKDDPERRVPLADKSVRNYVGPLSACLESAVDDGLIRANPARGVRLPKRATVEDIEAEEVRVFTDGQLDGLLDFLEVAHPRHRLFFELLAATGLRVSEAVGLEWRHLELDGSAPHVKVRQGVVRGVLGAPKTKHSKRDVPLPPDLVERLEAWRKETEWPGERNLVFTATNGSYLHVGNLRRRVLKPAAEEVGAPWAGFHAFRHTCASMLIADGKSVVQVSRWLGHHSAAFTLQVYAHLMADGVGGALSVVGRSRRGNAGGNVSDASGRHSAGLDPAEALAPLAEAA
jgi:integrase